MAQRNAYATLAAQAAARLTVSDLQTMYRRLDDRHGELDTDAMWALCPAPQAIDPEPCIAEWRAFSEAFESAATARFNRHFAYHLSAERLGTQPNSLMSR